jgi:prepilin-type N-terminal cleavage/methylation domain-containing protein
VTRRAFTLLEVLVSIALISGLIVTLLTFHFDLLRTRRRLADESARQLAASTLIERLERDLTTGLAGDRAGGAGVAGDETTIAVLTRAVPAFEAWRGPDAAEAFADLERAEYRFRAGAGVLEARRAVIAANGAAPGAFHEIGASIHRVRFRYHDGSAWRSSFDTLGAGALPAAVEVAVWFEPGPDETPRVEDEAAGLPAPEDEFASPDELLPLDDAPLPPPDRIRVVVIPDADAEEPDGGVR